MSALRMRLVAMLAIAWSTCAPGPAAAADVRPADAFVDSIGVNTHMTYVDTAYRDRGELVDKLAEAGIRHVRDGLSWDTQYAYDTFNDLASRGIHATFIMGDPTERNDTLDELLTVLRTNVSHAVEAVEGPNEYSHSGDPLWAVHLRAYQERLYAAVNDDPELQRLPVLAPSLITWQDHEQLGDLEDALDFGNKHSYPGGDVPEANLSDELSVAAKVSGDRPVYVTETGYHNAVATNDGHRPVSEKAAATYVPRMYLEYFRRGIVRTFAYELVDEWPDSDRRNQESNFGLLRNDYSEKPAFRSLANLISILKDGAGSGRLRPLDFEVADAPTDLRQLVLQKSDRSYYLILWRAIPVWDRDSRADLDPGEVSVTVRLGRGARAVKANLYSPVESPSPLATVPVCAGIPVSLGADPIVVKLPYGKKRGKRSRKARCPKRPVDVEPVDGTDPPDDTEPVDGIVPADGTVPAEVTQ
jgi:hypothetical protein